GEKDPNLPVLWVNLGEALDYSKKYDESADAYQKAIVLKPTEAGYFNNLGNVLAKGGKLPEASAAYQKSAELDPANAATAWRNFGIVLYNNNKMKEMVDPLQKSTVLDPKVADTWYLLGVGLMASMDSKQVGDKITFDIKPGTVEAYQKYLELAPTGKFANDAKGALTALESMGAQGVSTKMKVTKKKG
ncbi:MAG: tetratricopeptide repeat protein, partial [Acidobacteria bacterium]|nr:tetratricopeptide repeat protein [Acidobacteriota bacterium]